VGHATWNQSKAEVNMAAERPWKKPFDDLLEELTAYWGGTTEGYDDNVSPDGRSVPASYWLYPRYSVDVKGYDVRIEIREMPFRGMNFLEGGDNVEYLRISTLVESNFNAIIRHEHFFDRWKKALRLDWEFQTGSEEFDSKYFIIADHKDNPMALSDPKMQRQIVALEPFYSLQIGRNESMLSQVITDEDQLSIENVKPVIDNLLVFADSFER
jgi:hypothetical protein